MKIDLNNYEEYIIDYLEGNLSPDKYVEMKKFLQVRPELAQEILNLEIIPLQPNMDIVFKDKKSLKKSTRTLHKSFLYWCSGGIAAAVALFLYNRSVEYTDINTLQNIAHNPSNKNMVSQLVAKLQENTMATVVLPENKLIPDEQKTVVTPVSSQTNKSIGIKQTIATVPKQTENDNQLVDYSLPKLTDQKQHDAKEPNLRTITENTESELETIASLESKKIPLNTEIFEKGISWKYIPNNEMTAKKNNKPTKQKNVLFNFVKNEIKKKKEVFNQTREQIALIPEYQGKISFLESLIPQDIIEASK